VADLFIFAGEPSADLHGANLLKALRDVKPYIQVVGVGGPKMREEKLECFLPMEKFQVMGFVDVALAFPRLMRQFYQVRDAILKANPKVVVTIDYPEFNLRLARSLRKKGFKGKICHYICPSVWAWGKDRIQLLAKNYDLLMTILPFEKECFQHTGLRVEYVGHPLISTIPSPNFVSEENLIALFPGSRKKEIERNFPIQVAVAKKLVQDYPHLKFAISVAQPKFRKRIEKIAADLPHTSFVPSDQTRSLMQRAFVAIAKSGTVTLELGLHAIPTVVTYGISTLDTFLAKYVFRINLPHYCLVNIIGKKTVFPELIGPAFTEEALYSQVKNFLTNPSARSQCQEACQKVRSLLGSENASQKAASLLLSFLE
jgi:lipid-A-disaccharide synthase